MKYCPKCGHEMSDQAGFCEVCGNAFAAAQAPGLEVPRAKGAVKFKAVSVLNIIAFAVCLLFYLFIFLPSGENPTPPPEEEEIDGFTINIDVDPSPGYYGLEIGTLIIILQIVWPTLSIAIFVLGILSVKKRSKPLAYAYLAAAYLLFIALFKIVPPLPELLIMCGFGALVFAPIVMHTITGVLLVLALHSDAA